MAVSGPHPHLQHTHKHIRGQFLLLSRRQSGTNTPVSNAFITFTISLNGATAATLTATTNSQGVASAVFTWQVLGTYVVTASASVLSGTLPAQGSITYTVYASPTVFLTARVGGQDVSSPLSVLVGGTHRELR